MTFPGSPIPVSRIGAARNAIGHGLAAQDYGASFYENGGHPSAILSVANDPGPDKARTIKDSFNAARRSGEPSVLPSSITYTPIQVTPEDAEFLDAQRFSVEQIARFFRVPPEMVGAAASGQAVTYANVEQRGIDFLTYSIGPRLVRFEEALSSLLAAPQVVKFNTAALLRTDLASRYAAHAVGITNGFLTVNEVRELEDRPPLNPPEEV
jgi:HK97 family phage portal protein